MEWNRGTRPTQPASAPVNHETGTHSAPVKRGKTGLGGLRLASVFLLFAGTILVVALLAYIALGKNSSASQYVDDKKMQAVFLNGGQVYFGRIGDLNDRTMQLKDIYYLRVNQQVQPNQTNTQAANNDISLVKLGCELHGPQDSMVINQEQVIFWENLKEDGQVAKAVAEYKTKNPDGQKCDQAATGGTGADATTPAQQSTGTGTGTPQTTPTTTTPANGTRR